MPEKSGIDAAPCAPTLARLARSWAPPVAQRRGQPPPMSLIEGTPAAPSSCPPPDHGCVDFQSPRRPRHVPLAALTNATPFSGMPERGRRQLVAMATGFWGPPVAPGALRTVVAAPLDRVRNRSKLCSGNGTFLTLRLHPMLQRALVDAARRFSPPRVTSRSSLSFRRALAYVIGFLLLI